VEITEVRIKLMEDAGERLQGFCSITFDNCFVVRDLKIIDGANGPFVAMPSRKLTAHCPGCGSKNHLRASYCNQCGRRLNEERVAKDDDGRAKLYADIAHPINCSCREMIQEKVIRAFRDEVERSKLPGYVPSYDDFDEPDFERPARRPKAVPGAPSSSPSIDAEKTKIQPAEVIPRAPHTVATQVAAPPTSSSQASAPGQPAARNNKHSTFGAGIW
jgi:stage V sporulation protein G